MLQVDVTGVEHFELPVTFSVLAYFTFSVTGALAGLRRGYDIIGVMFLAFITAGGGGLIRDGILISTGPPSILTSTHLFGVILVGALLARVFLRDIDLLNRAIAIIDAIGLGAFAVHGVQRSLEGGLSVPGSILGGTITVVGGGLLRDILVREEPLLFKPGQFYALIAIGACCLFVALVRSDSVTPDQAALATIVATFVLRILVIRFNWRTTALSREPKPPATGGSGP